MELKFNKIKEVISDYEIAILNDHVRSRGFKNGDIITVEVYGELIPYIIVFIDTRIIIQSLNGKIRHVVSNTWSTSDITELVSDNGVKKIIIIPSEYAKLILDYNKYYESIVGKEIPTLSEEGIINPTIIDKYELEIKKLKEELDTLKTVHVHERHELYANSKKQSSEYILLNDKYNKAMSKNQRLEHDVQYWFEKSKHFENKLNNFKNGEYT